MKTLKIILISVACLVFLLLGISLLLPTDYKVERSVQVNADPAVVMAEIKNLRKFQEWSPWSKLDPEMKKEFTGNDGEVGAGYSWIGNEDVGKGAMEITAVTDKRVDIKLMFEEPMESEAFTWFDVAPEGAGTKVTWGMTGEFPVPSNIFLLFMDMDQMVGKDYEAGLAALKERVEGKLVD